jgi:hypothetical protein
MRLFPKLVAPCIAVILIGCGPSIGDINSKVKASIQEEFNKDPFYSEHCSLTDFTASKINGMIIGTAVVNYKGLTNSSSPENYQTLVAIKVSGKQIQWEMQPVAVISAKGFSATIN